MKRKVRGHIVIRRIWDDETKVYWKPRADASFLKVGNLRETTFAAFFSQTWQLRHSVASWRRMQM